jgi:hypothetical protein
VVDKNHKKEWNMSTATKLDVQAISVVMQMALIGTNLALVHIL